MAHPPGLGDLLAKADLLARLEAIVGPEGAEKARRNPHARRRPRPCGLTVHPGVGCSNACLYCYVGDLLGTGPMEPRPVGLSGPEMALSLASNPHFVPGRMGTFLAMGAICDPFHPRLVAKTLDIMASCARFLGNPVQFSTKMVLDAELVRQLPRGAPISPLVTIVTLERAKELEPRAPSPDERLKTILELRRAGFKPVLFLRPLMPGLVEHEADDIISEARAAGAVGVVAGALRVNRPIVERLKRIGLHEPILKRLRRSPPERKLVPVPSADLKELVLKAAEEKGLIPFKAACCANAFVAGVPCAGLCWLRGFCSSCPNGCPAKVPEAPEEDVEEALRTVFGLRARRVLVGPTRITIRLARPVAPGVDLTAVRMALEVATRRLIDLRP